MILTTVNVHMYFFLYLKNFNLLSKIHYIYHKVTNQQFGNEISLDSLDGEVHLKKEIEFQTMHSINTIYLE